MTAVAVFSWKDYTDMAQKLLELERKINDMPIESADCAIALQGIMEEVRIVFESASINRR